MKILLTSAFASEDHCCCVEEEIVYEKQTPN